MQVEVQQPIEETKAVSDQKYQDRSNKVLFTDRLGSGVAYGHYPDHDQRQEMDQEDRPLWTDHITSYELGQAYEYRRVTQQDQQLREDHPGFYPGS